MKPAKQQRRVGMSVVVFACLFGLVGHAVAQESAAVKPDEFRTFAAAVMAQWKVPGMAVAVVKGNQVVMTEVFGTRESGGTAPITPHTLFPIGCITKGITATSLGILADEGKIGWRRPVVAYLPEFKMRDEFATAGMTPRDLVANDSGLPRHDLMYVGADYSRPDIVRRVRYLEPTVGFREAYQYQNMMFTVAGYLVERVAETSWEEFVRARILRPLEMVETNFSVDDTQKAADFAMPHVLRGDAVRRVPFGNYDAMAPAGGINSTLSDMTRWLLMITGGGAINDRRVVAARTLTLLQTPQTVMTGLSPFPEMGPQSYGLGWIVGPYRGHYLVHHQGGIDGFKSMIMVAPRERIGILVLSNLQKTPVPEIIAYHLADRMLGMEPVDWFGRYRDAAIRARQQQGGEPPRRPSPAAGPSRPLASYTGEFEHPAYGTVSVVQADGILRVRFRTVDAPATFREGDTFEFENDLAEETETLTFTVKAQSADSLSIPLEPTGAPIVFTRVPDRAVTIGPCTTKK